VRFRQATHRYVATLEPPARLSYLRDIARSNAIALAHAVARCGREPLMHVSTSRDGANASNPRPHADYIDPDDFPPTWLDRDITVDIEAKAKGDAIVSLREALRSQLPTTDSSGPTTTTSAHARLAR